MQCRAAWPWPGLCLRGNRCCSQPTCWRLPSITSTAWLPRPSTGACARFRAAGSSGTLLASSLVCFFQLSRTSFAVWEYPAQRVLPLADEHAFAGSCICSNSRTVVENSHQRNADARALRRLQATRRRWHGRRRASYGPVGQLAWRVRR